MPAHLIRLRGGWEWLAESPGRADPVRLSLPRDWPEGVAVRGRLCRRFGRPPAAGAVVLAIESAEGLASVVLNGTTLPLEGGGPARREWPVGPLLGGRNLLELALDLRDPACAWGVVALEVDGD